MAQVDIGLKELGIFAECLEAEAAKVDILQVVDIYFLMEMLDGHLCRETLA
jgi:hypothetical protein